MSEALGMSRYLVSYCLSIPGTVLFPKTPWLKGLAEPPCINPRTASYGAVIPRPIPVEKPSKNWPEGAFIPPIIPADATLPK